MKEKDFSVLLLYDVYAPLLSEKKRVAFELSYWQDLSLSEIAEHTGTTRQGVRELINRTCDELAGFEEALHFAKIQKELLKISDEIEREHPDISDRIKASLN